MYIGNSGRAVLVCRIDFSLYVGTCTDKFSHNKLRIFIWRRVVFSHENPICQIMSQTIFHVLTEKEKEILENARRLEGRISPWGHSFRKMEGRIVERAGEGVEHEYKRGIFKDGLEEGLTVHALIVEIVRVGDFAGKCLSTNENSGLLNRQGPAAAKCLLVLESLHFIPKYSLKGGNIQHSQASFIQKLHRVGEIEYSEQEIIQVTKGGAGGKLIF